MSVYNMQSSTKLHTCPKIGVILNFYGHGYRSEAKQWRHWWELRAYLHGIVAAIYYQSNTFPNKMHIFAICDVAEPFNISFYGADNCAQTLKPSDSKQWGNHCLNGPSYLNGVQASGRVPQLCDNGWTDFQLWKQHFIFIQCWVGGINTELRPLSWAWAVVPLEKRRDSIVWDPV